jgi:hypothetical protein
MRPEYRLENGADMIDPRKGKHILATHFYCKLPSPRPGNSRWRYYSLNPIGFLDLRSMEDIKREIIENYTKDSPNDGKDFALRMLARPGNDEFIQIYRLVDEALRKRFKKESQALEAIGYAIDHCHGPNNYSLNPQDYMPLFQIEAPVFEYVLRKMNFRTTEKMFDFVLGG